MRWFMRFLTLTIIFAILWASLYVVMAMGVTAVSLLMFPAGMGFGLFLILAIVMFVLKR